MWLLFAFMSALFLGFYDVSKKESLKDNAVLPVLFLNTVFTSCIFIPFIIASNKGLLHSDDLFFAQDYGWEQHKYIVIKSIIVGSSWTLGYFGMKHLPITLVGPINATRPIMVLIGALLLFGERLTPCQWLGVTIAIISFFMLSHSGKKEGIDFTHNKWIAFVVLANILGAISGLYDKYLMASPADGGIGLDKMTVLSWYNIYMCGIMGIMLLVLWYPIHGKTTPFKWRWSIILISVFISAADFVYFYSLSLDGAMISIVSMIRRGSVVVSFFVGAMLFRERNLRSKAVDLALVILSMVFLFIGSKYGV